MELIDREKLQATIRNMVEIPNEVRVKVLGAVSRAKKVDAVEVVHGKWIRRHNETKCSKCKFIYYSNHDDFNYCPNCGAKMDGGAEDG